MFVVSFATANPPLIKPCEIDLKQKKGSEREPTKTQRQVVKLRMNLGPALGKSDHENCSIIMKNPTDSLR